jgi:shikimate dehydrogenase
MGDPVEHSVSPAMHNAAFRSLGLDYVYVPLRTPAAELAAAIAGVRALNIRGLNITIPHKAAAPGLLDEVDPLAAQIGAVNVLLNRDGRLTGYNTDAAGFLHVLKEHGVEPGGMEVAVLGAGGAARAICFALASRGAGLSIINRTLLSAQKCAADVSTAFPVRVQALELNTTNLSALLEKAAMLVNTTSAGMLPQPGVTLVDRSLLRPGLIVADIVYNPFRTQLLKDAEKAGARAINGLEMLIWQGALAFEIWTGRRPPLNVMRKAATAALKRYEK